MFKNKKLKNIISELFPFLVVIVIWELVIDLGIIKPFFLPSFSVVIQYLWEILISGELILHFGITIYRMVVGYVIGAVAAIILGMAIGLSNPMRKFFSPLIAATFPLPKISLLSLFIVVFGIGDPPIIASIVATASFPILLNTITGIVAADDLLVKAAYNLGANKRQVMTKVILPGALPIIFAGLKIGAAISLVVVIAVEMYISNSGVGYLLSWATEFFKMPLLYANLIAIGIFGVFIFKGLDRIEKWVIPWKKEN
jgi:NitT/TauT family transport system permease protein